MYLLLSGEGSGDIGACDPENATCDRDTFKAGPMAWIVDQVVENALGYDFSHLDTDRVSFVSESYLADNKQKPLKRAMALRGKKKPAETKYFFENARALAAAAKEKAEEIGDNVVAILFRDSDGTASAGRGLWRDKRESIKLGFAAEAFELGVAMVPEPKSEAWLLCAVKENPYQHCKALEDESGNDKGKNPLKDQLDAALIAGEFQGCQAQLVQEKIIDIQQIDMDSLSSFKTDLEAAVKATGAAK